MVVSDGWEGVRRYGSGKDIKGELWGSGEDSKIGRAVRKRKRGLSGVDTRSMPVPST